MCQGRSAIFRRRKSYALTSSADKTYLVSLGGRSETGAIPVSDEIQLMRILIFFFVLAK